MGLLDGLLGGGGSDVAKLVVSNPGVLQAALALLSPRDTSVGGSAGLAGLVQAFESKGLGSMMSSWIGVGPNPPVSASQIESVLGPDVLGQFARKAGMGAPDASGALAAVLPALVDHLTPDGQMPSGSGIDQAIGSLLGMMGR